MNVYKINDVIDSEFIRFPLALLAGSRYRQMSLEAKVVYSLLLNRLTLSQRNGWLNEKNEVYLIYTREETARTLNITYKKAIAAFKELIAGGLIIEQRRGRGFPNIIYLVKTDLSEPEAREFGENFDLQDRPQEPDHTDMPDGNIQTCQIGRSRYADLAVQDMPIQHIKTCQTGGPGYADTAVQDMPGQHTSKIDERKIDFSQIEDSQSVRPARTKNVRAMTDGRKCDEVDVWILERIFDRCEFEIWEDESVVTMFKTAIERMYYSESLKIGSSVLPRAKVRSYLEQIDGDVIVSAYDTLRKNNGGVRNVTGYIMSVLLNGICEKDSAVFVNLPPEYLGGSG